MVGRRSGKTLKQMLPLCPVRKQRENIDAHPTFFLLIQAGTIAHGTDCATHSQTQSGHFLSDMPSGVFPW